MQFDPSGLFMRLMARSNGSSIVCVQSVATAAVASTNTGSSSNVETL
jgi:hypothetical protein